MKPSPIVKIGAPTYPETSGARWRVHVLVDIDGWENYPSVSPTHKCELGRAYISYFLKLLLEWDRYFYTIRECFLIKCYILMDHTRTKYMRSLKSVNPLPVMSLIDTPCSIRLKRRQRLLPQNSYYIFVVVLMFTFLLLKIVFICLLIFQ